MFFELSANLYIYKHQNSLSEKNRVYFLKKSPDDWYLYRDFYLLMRWSYLLSGDFEQ